MIIRRQKMSQRADGVFQKARIGGYRSAVSREPVAEFRSLQRTKVIETQQVLTAFEQHLGEHKIVSLAADRGGTAIFKIDRVLAPYRAGDEMNQGFCTLRRSIEGEEFQELFTPVGCRLPVQPRGNRPGMKTRDRKARASAERKRK